MPSGSMRKIWLWIVHHSIESWNYDFWYTIWWGPNWQWNSRLTTIEVTEVSQQVIGCTSRSDPINKLLYQVHFITNWMLSTMVHFRFFKKVGLVAHTLLFPDTENPSYFSWRDVMRFPLMLIHTIDVASPTAQNLRPYYKDESLKRVIKQ